MVESKNYKILHYVIFSNLLLVVLVQIAYGEKEYNSRIDFLSTMIYEQFLLKQNFI
jgi:hypothetical protein